MKRIFIFLGTFILLLNLKVNAQILSSESERCRNIYYNEEALEALHHFMFKDPYEGPRKKQLRTNSLIVVHQSCIIKEDYSKAYEPTTKHLAWSVSKSVTGILIGVAESQGILSRSDLVSKYLPNLRDNLSGDLKIMDLLYWSSGLEWEESYEFAPFFSDVAALLYTRGKDDMTAYVLSLPSKFKPGERWHYSTGDSTLLMASLQAALGNQTNIYQFIENQLFEKLGIQDWTWEADAMGTLSGGSYLFMRPKDMAKLGQLMLQGGRWGSEQLLPTDWLKLSSSLAPGFTKSDYLREEGQGNAGAHWWTNRSDPNREIGLAYPDAPEDLFTARGHWGQFVTIVPSLDLVAVRTGDELDGSFRLNDYFKLLVKVVEPKARKASK